MQVTTNRGAFEVSKVIIKNLCGKPVETIIVLDPENIRPFIGDNGNEIPNHWYYIQKYEAKLNHMLTKEQIESLGFIKESETLNLYSVSIDSETISFSPQISTQLYDLLAFAYRSGVQTGYAEGQLKKQNEFRSALGLPIFFE